MIRTDKDLDRSEYNTTIQQSHGEDVQVNNILIIVIHKNIWLRYDVLFHSEI